MHSPTKNAKKTRKNNFSQVAVAQAEVGDFSGGYFVMPDATSSKENDCPHKTRAQSSKSIERSPARRKNQTSDSTSSPHKERVQRFEQDFKKPFAEMSADIKKDNRNELALSGGYTASPKKAPASPKQQTADLYDQKYSSSKDSLSTSPPSSGRWAGPAFGNAPHPSSLPLPEFPPMYTNPSLPAPFMTQESHRLSKSPSGHEGAFLGMVCQQYTHQFAMSSSPPTHLTPSIPVVPFPYVGASQHPPAHVAPSLAQLSTDLRRMLNINDAVPVPILGDPIMVSANSA